MNKAITLFLLFLFQFVSAQEDYSKYKPIEPLYTNGGVANFYQYLSQNINLAKVANEKDVIIGFVLDASGKMNHIKVAFCNDAEAEKEIRTALQKAAKWDVSNQQTKGMYIRFKMKLIFLNNEVKGLTSTSWFSEDVPDFTIHKNDFPAATKLTTNVPTEEAAANHIYNSAGLEFKPEYPGGMPAFYAFISKNYNPPNVKGLKGRVIVSFVVEKDGTLGDFRVLKDIGYGSGEEAIRVLKLCEKWQPATQDGVPVRCSYQLPLNIETDPAPKSKSHSKNN